MKDLILLLNLFPLVLYTGCDNSLEPNFVKGEWKLVDSRISNGYINGLYFADGKNGWVIGDSGKILNTNDGGNSWTLQESHTNNYLKCVCFADSLKGWIGGGNNSIGITTNGGITWNWQHPEGEPNRIFMAISFINENTGWIGDNYGGIHHTENGGQIWEEQNSGTSWAITAIQFLNNDEGWATGTNRVVLHTTDGGKNWIVKILDSLSDMSVAIVFDDIYFCNSSKGWIATNAAASSMANPQAPVVRTVDNGKNWFCCPTTEQTYWISSIRFVNENIGWAACQNGILFSSNGGHNWNYQLQSTDGIIVDINFVDQTHGWAVSFIGDIYKYQAL